MLDWAVAARCQHRDLRGGAGAGKTTLLNALAASIPSGERVVTIEDAAELRLPGDHVVRLESRPPSAEGLGEVRIRELVRAALRMRPDRIVVGEVRSGEALDMLQAMNTGHEGSLSTCHANGPLDALRRLETMVLMGDVDLPHTVVREQRGPPRSTSSCTSPAVPMAPVASWRSTRSARWDATVGSASGRWPPPPGWWPCRCGRRARPKPVRPCAEWLET